MWTFLKALLTKVALLKVLLRTLGSLAWLVPVAFILKAIGLPVLLLLLVLALPIFIVLALVGLPILLVVVFGGMLVAGLFAMVSIGLVALKIALPIMLLVWFVQWLLRDRRTSDGTNPAT